MAKLVTYGVYAGARRRTKGEYSRNALCEWYKTKRTSICPLYVLLARNRVPPLEVVMEIDSHQLLMEVDAGAAYSHL